MSKLTERYKSYDKRTYEWMCKMIHDLESELGSIPDSYVIQLDLIADAFGLYTQANDEIRKRGIMVTGRNGEYVKNPVIPLLNSTQLFISKLLGSFAMTRASKARLGKELSDENKCPMDEYV